MKINSIKTTTGYLNKGRGLECSLNNERECAKERAVLKQNNIDQINTTIESNSDGRVSFKGGTPFLHSAANVVLKNPIVAEAAFAILITCGLRPLTIMATAKTDEEKGKCTYQAVKSVSTGVVGLAMSILVATPLSKLINKAKDAGALKIPPALEASSKETVEKGVKALSGYLDDAVKNTGIEETFIGQIKDLIKDGKMNLDAFKGMGKGAEKEFGKKLLKRSPEVFKQYTDAANAQKVLNNYSSTAKNVLDKLFQPVFMPIRATVTIALIPIIMNALGIKKGGKKPKEAEAQPNAQQEVKQEAKQSETPKQEVQQSAKVAYDSLKLNMFQGNNDKELFNHFAEVAKYEN